MLAEEQYNAEESVSSHQFRVYHREERQRAMVMKLLKAFYCTLMKVFDHIGYERMA